MGMHIKYINKSNQIYMHYNTAGYCIICFGMHMRLGIPPPPHDSIQMDLIAKALFNEHKHVLVWECPKVFRPYCLVCFIFVM